jgi:hypothetical protein
MRQQAFLCGLLLAALLAVAVSADEGMWTFNNFPKQLIKERYGFEPSDAWLDHVRLSSVRFNNGGSGSFASPDGLVLTNHHVGLDCIHELSSAERDYHSEGFYARTRKEELRCPNLELNVVAGIEDVTAEVNTEVTAQMDAAARNAAQRGARARIEKECTEATGLRCDVVVLYEGGVFNLYRYKKYTDIRLVFAPESTIAAYGGDPDNFNYPRYCLDFAFFRVYEDGQPARTEHYLRWNPTGIDEGDVAIISGNPGSTGRQQTLAQLEFLRDVHYRARLETIEARLEVMREYASRGAEEARIVAERILTYENSLKAYTGYQSGLTDEKLMVRKAAAEKAFQEQVATESARQRKYGNAWEDLAKAQQAYASFYPAFQLLESRFGLEQVRLFDLARTLVRLTAETVRPNEQRLREFRESNLGSLKQDLFSAAPIYPTYEKVMLTRLLEETREQLGADDPLVRGILAGRTPAAAAAAYVEGSGLASVEARQKLAEGGQGAVEASDDAMIALARLVDERARGVRKRYEDEVQAVERKNGSLLAQALFETQGTTTYPEATFTLRLSFGAVKGYVEDGMPRRWYTTFHGLYEREAGIEPYKMPESWRKKKNGLNLDTPYNFVTTNDIIGGNSGSPVVNRKGEFVGIIFDGNIQMLPNRFLYTDEVARAVSVHAAAIVEALRGVYGAEALLGELTLSNAD